MGSFSSSSISGRSENRNHEGGRCGSPVVFETPNRGRMLCKLDKSISYRSILKAESCNSKASFVPIFLNECGFPD